MDIQYFKLLKYIIAHKDPALEALIKQISFILTSAYFQIFYMFILSKYCL
jgi:hypothetical protein